MNNRTAETPHRVIIRIRGDVQGVGFRYSVWLKARELGLAGFARNELGGNVYIEAEGSRDKLEELLQWCENGAPGKVERVEREFWDEVGGYEGFEAR